MAYRRVMSAKDNTVTRKVFSNAYNIQAPMDDSNYISRVFRVLLVSRSGRSTIDCTTLRNKEVTYNEDHAEACAVGLICHQRAAVLKRRDKGVLLCRRQRTYSS